MDGLLPDFALVSDEGEHQRAIMATATVEAFVLRARRVRAHSLAADVDALRRLINPSWRVTLHPGSDAATLTRRLPPEEAVESLAARVRPLILARDPVHHGKVLRALRHLLRGAPDSVIDRLDDLKRAWREINSESNDLRAYRVEVGPVDRSHPPTAINDNTLAFAWFYGDVVHADAERRESAAAFTVRDRFQAAVPVVAHAALLSHLTLHFVEAQRAAGALHLSDGVFQEDVHVDTTEITQEARVNIAPVGTAPPPSLEHDFGPEWTRLTPQPEEPEATDHEGESP